MGQGLLDVKKETSWVFNVLSIGGLFLRHFLRTAVSICSQSRCVVRYVAVNQKCPCNSSSISKKNALQLEMQK
jgi:hypothetical protein